MEGNAEWVPVIGPIVASVTALGIAVWQHKAAHEVAHGAQKERAALTAISHSDGTSVTVANHGPTPVFDVRLESWRDVLARDGEEGPFILVEDEAHAQLAPMVWSVLPPGDSKTFTYPEWSVDSGPVEQSDEYQLSTVIKVLLRFTDAAGTRWERQGNGRPRSVGGTPLPGTVGFRSRLRRWCSKRYRLIKRGLRLGFKGKGFTQRGRARKREKRHQAVR